MALKGILLQFNRHWATLFDAQRSLSTIPCIAAEHKFLPKAKYMQWTTGQNVPTDSPSEHPAALEFQNRNPRNLERLAFAMKDEGWKTSWPPRNYWHRIVIHRSQKHITAWLEGSTTYLGWGIHDCPESSPQHVPSVAVVTVSTKEWAIRSRLGKTTGPAVGKIVGLVLARRCLQAGLGQARFQLIPREFRRVQTVQSFWMGMKEGGFVLSEPRRSRGTWGVIPIPGPGNLGARREALLVLNSDLEVPLIRQPSNQRRGLPWPTDSPSYPPEARLPVPRRSDRPKPSRNPPKRGRRLVV
uniref:large ribosomal subunit protein uL18m n=1 Tax=Myxine glutinosa TaxID=7769 RepID=UPI00358F77CE